MAGGSPPEASPRLGGHPAFLPIPAWDITPGGFAGMEQRPPGHGCTPTPLLLGVPGSIPRVVAAPGGSSRSEQGEGKVGIPSATSHPGRQRGWSCCTAVQSPIRAPGCARGEQGPSLPPRPLLRAEERAWGPVAASGPPGQMIPPLQRRVLGCWMLHSLLGIPLGIP